MPIKRKHIPGTGCCASFFCEEVQGVFEKWEARQFGLATYPENQTAPGFPVLVWWNAEELAGATLPEYAESRLVTFYEHFEISPEFTTEILLAVTRYKKLPKTEWRSERIVTELFYADWTYEEYGEDGAKGVTRAEELPPFHPDFKKKNPKAFPLDEWANILETEFATFKKDKGKTNSIRFVQNRCNRIRRKRQPILEKWFPNMKAAGFPWIVDLGGATDIDLSRLTVSGFDEDTSPM